MAEFPQHLLSLCWMLPERFVAYLSQLCGVETVLSDNSSTCPRPAAARRNRDLLPLPFVVPSAEDMPRKPVAENLATLCSACKGWLLLMVCALNSHWGLGSVERALSPPSGPPSRPQYSSLVRLATAADAICEMHPGELPECDWRAEMKHTRVSYEGEEVSVAEALTVEQVIPGLPPKAIAGSIDIVPLLDGHTRECILKPSLMRLSDDEVDRTALKRPSVRAPSVEEKDALMITLWEYNICGVVDDAEVWKVDGFDVENGMFGVKRSVDQVTCRDGKKRSQLRTIMHMVPSNSLQEVILGDINMLPHEGQWNSLHLTAFEILSMSLRDRKAYFYAFYLPRVWWGAFTSCHRVNRGQVGRPDLDEARLASRCPAMGWKLAVGVTQMAHRGMLRRARETRPSTDTSLLYSPEEMRAKSPTLEPRFEIRRDRAFPVTDNDDEKSAWLI